MDIKKLYYLDTYQKEAKGKIIFIDGNKIYLDQTICYAECGGQPGDKGYLDNVEIIDTQSDERGTYHLCSDNNFKLNQEVAIKLDWQHRYRFMKVHTAQHIISGLLYSAFNVGTLSVHQGQEFLTIEIDKNEFEIENCHKLEDLVNSSITAGREISYREMSKDDAIALDLRRSVKADGIIRIVDIDGVDSIACGGIHVNNTREIGFVLYSGQQMVRSHVRLMFKVADVAIEQIRLMQSIINELNVRHSTQIDGILDFDKVQTEKYLNLEKENRLLKKENAKSFLTQLKNDDAIISKDLSDYNIDLQIFSEVIEDEDLAVCFITRVENSLRWFIYLGPSYSKITLKYLKTELFPLINAKGGGKPPYFQGKGDIGGETEFLGKFRTIINER